MFGRAITFGAPAGSVSGLASASPAPSATNPFVTADQATLPSSAASVAVAVAAAGNGVILAAPPAGFYHYIHSVQAYNQSGAATAGYQVKEGATLVIFGSSTTGIAASGVGSVGGQIVSGALTGLATGTGNLIFVVNYSRIATANIGMWQIALTDTYQAIASLAPAAGFCIMPVPVSIFSLTNGRTPLMNADSGACVPMMKLTRGGVDYIQTGASVAANVRSLNCITSIPHLIAGDVVSVKASSAPTANTVTMGGVFQTVPLLV